MKLRHQLASEGTFVLADIGGYTQFLTGVGIEHAKEITSHLFNSLLKCNRERWKVANIEGDCIFFYRPGREPPDELLEHIRTMFEVFCDRTIDIAERASCPCGACTRTGALTLKFIVHAGEYDTQRIGNREELIGPDVVVAHRLLKNSVSLPEYALITRAYAPGDLPTGLPALPGREQYDDVGAVEHICLDLSPVRAEHEESRQVFVTADGAQVAVTREIDAPPEMVWEAVAEVDYRRQWQKSVKQDDVMEGKQGAIGAIHRCIHNDGSKFVHVVVAIDEAGRRGTEKIWASRLFKDAYMTFEARALDDGRTSAGFYLAFRPAIPVVSHIIAPVMARMMTRGIREDLADLKAFCEEKTRAGAEGPEP